MSEDKAVPETEVNGVLEGGQPGGGMSGGTKEEQDSISILRPDDLLAIEFFYSNLEHWKRSGQLRRIVKSQSAYLIAKIPQQHISEELFVPAPPQPGEPCRDNIKPPASDAIYQSRISGYSYIALKLPDNTEYVKVEDLLDWSGWDICCHKDIADIKLVPADLSEAYPVRESDRKPSIPSALANLDGIPVTLFEAPYKLFLTPVNPEGRNQSGVAEYRFEHDNSMRIAWESTERKHPIKLTTMWANSLNFYKSNRDGESNELPKFKAVGFAQNDDPSIKNKLLPNQGHRNQLAQLTNIPEYNRDISAKAPFIFSSAGATASLKYFNLNPKPPLFIARWKQDFRFGRDNYIEITELAIDARTGLKVLISVIGERRVSEGRSFELFRTKFEYLEKQKDYSNVKDHGDYPFRHIEALSDGAHFTVAEIDNNGELKTNPSTPTTSADPNDPDGNGLAIEFHDSFYAISENCPLEFKHALKLPYRIRDRKGRLRDIKLDAYFVRKTDYDQGSVKECLARLNKSLSKYPDELEIQYGLDKLGFAEEPQIPEVANGATRETNTEVPTQSLQFYSHYNGQDYEEEYSITPKLQYAKVIPPQLEGVNAVSKPVYARYSDTYLDYQLDTEKNSAGVFLTFADDSITDAAAYGNVKNALKKPLHNLFSQDYQRIGGIAEPDLVIESLSTKKQSLLLTDQISRDYPDITKLKTKDVIRGVNAEIVGGINLQAILEVVLDEADLPKIEMVDDLSEAILIFDKYKAEYKNLVSLLQNAKHQIDSYKRKLALLKPKAAEKQFKKYLNSVARAVEYEFEQQHHQLILDVETTLDEYYEAAYKQLAEGIANLPPEIAEIKPAVDAMRKAFHGVTMKTLIEELSVLTAEKPETFALGEDWDPIDLEKIRGHIDVAFAHYETSIVTAVKAYSGKLEELKRNAPTSETATKITQQVSDFSSIAFAQLWRIFHKADLSLNGLDKKTRDIFAQRILPALPIANISELKATLGEQFELIDVQKRINELAEPLDARLNNLLDASTAELNKVLDRTDEYLKEQRDKWQQEEALAQAWLEEMLGNVYSDLEATLSDVRSYNEIIRVVEQSAHYDKLTNAIADAREIEQRLGTTLETSRGLIDDKLSNYKQKFKTAQTKKLEQLKNSFENHPALQEAAAQTEQLVALLYEKQEEAKELERRLAKLKKGYLDTYKTASKIAFATATKYQGKIDEYRAEVLKREGEIREFFGRTKTKIELKLKEAESNLESAIKAKASTADVQKWRNIVESLKTQLKKIQEPAKKSFSYAWQTEKFREATTGFVTFSPQKNPKTNFSVDVESSIEFALSLDKPSVAVKTTARSQSSLTNFDITFFRAVTVSFNKLSFETGTDIDDNFDVEVSDVEFNGPLNFISTFQEYLNSTDLGFDLSVSTQAAELRYSLPLPEFSGGAYNFAMGRVDLGVDIPFRPRVPMRLNVGINSPDRMFLVTVGIYGGRGCFQLTLEPKRGIVGALLIIEFGAVFFLNVGAAKGIVYLFAGIYFRKTRRNIELRAYLTAGGRLNIAGLITASVVFYMGLRSTDGGDSLYGQCSVTLKISIGRFFETRVRMVMKKKLAGTSKSSKRSKKADGLGIATTDVTLTSNEDSELYESSGHAYAKPASAAQIAEAYASYLPENY